MKKIYTIIICTVSIMFLFCFTGCEINKSITTEPENLISSDTVFSIPDYSVNDNGDVINAHTGDIVSDIPLSVDESGNIVNTETGSVVETKEDVQIAQSTIVTSQVIAKNPEQVTQQMQNPKENTSNTQTNIPTQSVVSQVNDPTTPSSAVTPSITSTPSQSESSYTEESNESYVSPWIEATEKDSKAVAEKVLEYLNQYRNAEGKPSGSMLPNMTKYAEYRAQQLTTNFAHDSKDERAAATALKYGKHIIEEETLYDWDTDTIIHTGNILDYYSAGGIGEAIVWTGGGVLSQGTVDAAAERLASGIKNSVGHWDYVGYSKNIYISVGCAYANGNWYCEICVSDADDIYG